MKNPGASRDRITEGRAFHFEAALRAQQRGRKASTAAATRQRNDSRRQEQAHERR